MVEVTSVSRPRSPAQRPAVLAPEPPTESRPVRLSPISMRVGRVGVTHPTDPDEHAADSAAAQVMQGQTVSGVASTKAMNDKAPPAIEVGDGHELDAGVRQNMERRFRTDFSDVRVHTGKQAAAASASLHARAFTSGQSIAFGSAEYAPTTASGERLLAHELAHVVQGRDGRKVRRSPLPFDSFVKIHHNLLRSRPFDLAAGQGVVVNLTAEWYMDDDEVPLEERSPVDLQSVDRPPGLIDTITVGIERDGVLWNSSKGASDASVGTWNQLTFKTDDGGVHRVVVDVADHNHNFYLHGPIHVREAAGEELADAASIPESLSASEALHYVLDVAGLIPVLGIIPDAANSGFYLIEGDWGNAGLSAVAMVPVLGEGATATKLGVRVSKSAAKRLDKRIVATALRETRLALKRLRVPPAFAHTANAGVALDTKLLTHAKDLRVTQAGVSRAAFGEFNVATARVRVGSRTEILGAGNSPGKMMHSEDWILSQVEVLKKQTKEKVFIEQLYSERIPCAECMAKLRRTNAELFYTVREYGKRAEDLMRAYGL